MKKAFALLNAILIIGVLIGDVYYIRLGTLRIKAVTSILFTLIGAVNLLYANITRTSLMYPAIMAGGLFFAMLGDIMLGYSFIYGAMLFGIGHVLFFISFCVLMPPKTVDLVSVAPLCAAAVAFLLFYPRFRFGSAQMLQLCAAYAIVIALMTGKSAANFFRRRNFVCAIAMIGSAAFFVSDLMLVLHKFAHAGKITDTLCLAFYYPAECLLGFSSFLYINRAVRN